jgi:hypothetical protein
MNRRIFFVLFILLLLGLTLGTASAQNSYSLWSVRYWSNPDLEGSPVASASTGVIDYNWGSGVPAAGIPADHWSGRWTSYVDFEAGIYRIHTYNDDGVRVFLGDKHVIYDWNKHPPLTNEVTVSLLGGTYSMAVDYFEDVGGALLQVGWERIGPPQPGAADVTVIASQTSPPAAPPPQADWLAHYWNNTNLSGNSVLTRNEAAISYDWGTGSPAPDIVNVNFFSARWSRSIAFDTGSYRFTTQSDDGIRVFVNGQLIINNWTTHALETNTADINMVAGTYPVIVESFENAHHAVAKFWWEKTDSAGVGIIGVSATTTPSWLNMRAGPSITYSILDVLPRGTVVPVVGRTSTSRWIQVVFAGQTGWLSTPYTTINGDINSVPLTG